MGSGSGSAGNPEQAVVGQGRHRRDEAVAAWPTRESTKALARVGLGGRGATRHGRQEVGPTGGTADASGGARGDTAAGVGTGAASGRVAASAVAGAASRPGATVTGGVSGSTGMAGSQVGGLAGGGDAVGGVAEAGAGEQGDPLDTGLIGLRMFNLGTIPASVTPPRSWRRAAWFTVVASVAALAGLLAVGTMLMGPAQDKGRLLALPYFPDGTPLAAIGGAAGSQRAAGSGQRSAASQVATDDVAEVGDPVPLSTRRAAPRTGGITSTTFPNASAPVVVTLPPVVASAIGGDPVVDPTKLIKRTRTFFAEVTSNAKAAADLTANTARDDAIALIHQKYGDVSKIQVRSISLDPNSGLTISVLRVVNKNGTTSTWQTALQFTLTGDPKIINPGG